MMSELKKLLSSIEKMIRKSLKLSVFNIKNIIDNLWP